MAAEFFKKVNNSIAQCSRSSFIGLVFLFEFTDLFTAYLHFLVKPLLFLNYEMNPWIKAAFYYGQWEKLLVPWTVLTISITVYFLALTFLKKRRYLNHFPMLIIVLFSGAALTNVCGIVFDSYHQGRLVFVLTETIFLILLASTAMEQIDGISRNKKRGMKASFDH